MILNDLFPFYHHLYNKILMDEYSLLECIFDNFVVKQQLYVDNTDEYFEDSVHIDNYDYIEIIQLL